MPIHSSLLTGSGKIRRRDHSNCISASDIQTSNGLQVPSALFQSYLFHPLQKSRPSWPHLERSDDNKIIGLFFLNCVLSSQLLPDSYRIPALVRQLRVTAVCLFLFPSLSALVSAPPLDPLNGPYLSII